jgi:hypothetical protein
MFRLRKTSAACRGRREIGPFWQAEKGQQRGYAMANAGDTSAPDFELRISGGLAVRPIRQLGAVGLAFELENDRTLHQTI